MMKATTTNCFRWVLLTPFVLALFYFWVLISLGAYQLANLLATEYLCNKAPAEYAPCLADILDTTKESLLFLVPACAAVSMICGAYAIAPKYKLLTAAIVFALGSLAAAYYALDSSYWHSFVLTELVSGLALFGFYKKRSS